MNDEFWHTAMVSITGTVPVNIDDDLPKPRAVRAGATRPAGPIPAPAEVPPSTLLFGTRTGNASYFGVRVTEPLGNPVRVATRLAAGALERQVVPIVLTTLALSGLEQFGFRTERLAGDEAAVAAAERELAAFWDLSIIIDAADIDRLG